MPVRLISREFTDINSVTLPSYRSNAGDIMKATFVVGDITQVFSLNNAWSYNITTKTITWSGGNWLAEGFRLGDTIQCTIYNATGGTVLSASDTIAYISETELQTTTTAWYTDLAASQYLEIKSSITNQEIRLSYAHVINETGGTDLSLIDGNRSLFALDVSGMAVSDVLPMPQIGYKSGDYACNITVTRLANVGSEKRYEIECFFVQGGIPLQSFFDGNDCLKVLFNFEFVHIIGEVDNHSKLVYDELANTGWFNSAYNNDTPNSILTSNVSEVYYNAPTTFQVVVSDINVRIGAIYVPIDDPYFKDKYNDQATLGMYINLDATAIGVNASSLNPLGAGYSIEVVSFSTTSGIATIDCVFNPNGAFNTFFNDPLKDQDRRLILWVHSGNTNWTLFDGQLTEVPKAIIPLNVVKQGWDLHPMDLYGWSSKVLANEFNKEDDIAKYIDFKLPKNKVFNLARLSVISGGTTLDSYTFNPNLFDLSTGLVNFSDVNVLELPSTFNRRLINYRNRTSLNDASNWGVRMHYGFLLNWRAWQGNDWYTYPNPTVRIDFVTEDDYVYRYEQLFTILNYDDWAYSSQINFFKIDTLQELTSVLENEQIYVVATHTLTPDKMWGQVEGTLPWGQISVEQYQGSIRHEISTEQPVDGTQLSLKPISSLTQVATLSFSAPNVARIVCIFDPFEFDLTQGLSFTTKIWGDVLDNEMLLITDLDELITANGDNIVVE